MQIVPGKILAAQFDTPARNTDHQSYLIFKTPSPRLWPPFHLSGFEDGRFMSLSNWIMTGSKFCLVTWNLQKWWDFIVLPSTPIPTKSPEIISFLSVHLGIFIQILTADGQGHISRPKKIKKWEQKTEIEGPKDACNLNYLFRCSLREDTRPRPQHRMAAGMLIKLDSIRLEAVFWQMVPFELEFLLCIQRLTPSLSHSLLLIPARTETLLC